MKAVFRTAKLKTFGNIGGLNAHCERTMDVPNADKELQPFNKHKIGSADMVADVKARMLEANIDIENLRKNGVLAFEVVLSASPEFFDLKKTNEGGKIGLSLRNVNEAQAWVNQSTNWLKEEFGANLVSVHLHNDEKTPHIHAVVVPIDPKGRMNCSHFLGDKIKLAKMQDRYADSVKSLGLERGVVGSKDIHKQPSKFHAEQVEKRKEEEKSIEARVKVLKTERLSESSKIQEVKKDLDNYKAIEQQHQNRLNALQNQIKSLEKESELIISKAKDDAKKITDAASMKLAQVNDYVSKITNNVDIRIAEAINQKFNIAPAFYLDPHKIIKEMPKLKIDTPEPKTNLLGAVPKDEHERIVKRIFEQVQTGLDNWKSVFHTQIIEASDVVGKELKQIADYKHAQEAKIQREIQNERRLQEARNQSINKEKGKDRGPSM
jgi:hypothetical protein